MPGGRSPHALNSGKVFMFWLRGWCNHKLYDNKGNSSHCIQPDVRCLMLRDQRPCTAKEAAFCANCSRANVTPEYLCARTLQANENLLQDWSEGCLCRPSPAKFELA